MEMKHKNNIYDRLLAIKFSIDIQAVPNPQHINEKIGECHTYIGEVERYSIETSKEISIVQQALNNALTDYEMKKEDLLTQDPIKSLPNIKDREAQANINLRTEQKKIKKYTNEVTDLNNLLKAINLKSRNLNRANTDIKIQLRILEAQIKLGAGPTTNIAIKSMLEEFKKSTIGTDLFQEASTEAEEDKIVDPTSPLDVENLFTENEPPAEDISEKLIDPVPELSPDTEDISTTIPVEKDWPVIDQKVIKEVEASITETDTNQIDLDEAIDPDQKGGETSQNETQIVEEVAVPNQKEAPSKQISGIDIDDLLDSFQPKHK